AGSWPPSTGSWPRPTPCTARAGGGPASETPTTQRLALAHGQPPGYQWKAPDSARFLLVPAPGGLTMTQGPRTDRGEPSYHEPVLASGGAEVLDPLPVAVVG